MTMLRREVAQAVVMQRLELEHRQRRPVAPGHSKFLVQQAKRLERLQDRRRKLRRELRRVEQDIKTQRRLLAAVQRELAQG